MIPIQQVKQAVIVVVLITSVGILLGIYNSTGIPKMFTNTTDNNASTLRTSTVVNTSNQRDTQSNSSIDAWLQTYKGGSKHPNILFIVADDMRPEIGAQIHDQSPWLEPGIVTPNLDSLASRGLLFRRAYCQFAWCNPSRSSLLTSRRPDTTMVHNNTVYFRQNNPNFVALPQYFKNQGYITLGMGKVFHRMNMDHDSDEPYSWTLPVLRVNHKLLKESNGHAWEAVRPEDRQGKLMLDEAVTEFAKETLNRLSARKDDKQPFFMAVGIKKPHFNFEFPVQFMDNYPLENVSMPKNPTASPSLPDIAWFTSFEVRHRTEYKNETDLWERDRPLVSWLIRDLRRAYYSCITYIDDLIGQLLQHLEDVGLANDTIISFIGDHGFHLGEHSIVGKNTAFEVANNAPMMIRVPGVTDGGFVTDKLVEFVDLFPTLVELAGLPKMPYCPGGAAASRGVDLCTEGTSLVPLLRDPSTDAWKDRIFFQYPHYKGYRAHFNMGYSMRTSQYRYTEWIDYDYDWEVKANWTNVCDAELYDHAVDPLETQNLADDPKLTEVRQDLSAKLRAGWPAALPRAV